MIDERISALEKLVESGIMSIDAARTARLKILEEKLMEDKITTPSIIERERNGKIRYICVIPKSLSKDGERHQVSGATPDECREKWMDAVYDNMEYQQDCKRKQEQQPETLCELMEEWMDKKKEGIKPQTISGYHSHYENHIRDSKFGQYKIKEIKLPECENFINKLINHREMTEDGREVGLGYDSIRHIKSEISMALDYAVSHEYIVANHMRAVKINQGLCCTERKHETEAWTDEELRAIELNSMHEWNQHRKYRLSAAIMILALCGCRAGELVDATWDDVDFNRGTFTITSTYTSYKDYDTGEFIRGTSTPKTPSSRRTLELTDSALYWFKELKRRNQQLGIRSNHLIVTKKGTITNQRDLNVRIQVFCKAMGIKYKSTHAGRRTYASILLENNVPLPEVSADLGHKKNSTTLDTYYKGRSKKNTMTSRKNAIFLATVGNSLQHGQNAEISAK